MFFEYLSSLDPFSWQAISILLISGFLVGFINTVAGNGTIISFTIFMGMGLPINIANGTTRLGVVMQTLAASLFFKGSKILDVKKGLLLGIPCTIGSITGAQIAVNIDKDIFKILLGVVLIVMLFLMFFKSGKWMGSSPQKQAKPVGVLQIIVFFLIGMYGGFIHIGVGLFLLAALMWLSGYDLVRANALKVFIVLLYSPFALAVFVISGQINYSLGLISAIGNIAGGIVGSKMAISWGAGFLKWFISVIIILSLIDIFKLYKLFL